MWWFMASMLFHRDLFLKFRRRLKMYVWVCFLSTPRNHSDPRSGNGNRQNAEHSLSGQTNTMIPLFHFSGSKHTPLYTWNKNKSFNCLVGWSKYRLSVLTLQTEPPAFAPTFKTFRGKEEGYSTKRVPSYTDRILWKSLPGHAPNLDLLEFDSFPQVRVLLTFLLYKY